MDEAKILEHIDFLAKEILDCYKLINKLANVVIAQQVRIEVFNKELLNFIPDSERRGNQIIQ